MKEMQSVFGPLKRNGTEWSTGGELELFGAVFAVEIIVEGNDRNATVLPEQTEAMTYYKNNESQVLGTIENAILDHYREEVNDEGHVSKESVRSMIECTGLVFPLVVNRGYRTFGVLLECDWDKENGLAVKLEGERVEVGSQDLLT